MIAESYARLRIGDALTDSEHEALLRFLQRLLETPDSSLGRDEFFDRLGQLGREISRHFAHEEALMHSLQMPAGLVSEHVQAHEGIIEQYAELNLDLMHGKQYAREELVKMIREWILEHILIYDLKIKAFIPET